MGRLVQKYIDLANDFTVDLDKMAKWLKCTKGHLKETLKNSYIKDLDYTIKKSTKKTVGAPREIILLTPDAFKLLSDTLKQLLNHPFAKQYENKVDFSNTADICYRLSELLPISNKEKQLLLETDTTEQMLDMLVLHINALQS